MVSSTLGSPTNTGWKRRSNAGSFSMCLRYSSSVVAPMVRNSPRASIGFNMFEASIDPSAAPAPTTVCSSSMKRMIFPAASVIFLQDGFQALFELAPEFRPRDQRAQIERDHPLVLEVLRHVTAHDALRQPLGDGRLTDAGLADQHRVVLRPPRKNLHYASDLFVAANDRVELALLRQLRKVTAILLERLVLVLWVGISHALPSTNLGESLIDAVFRHAEARQQLCRPGVEPIENAEQQMLGTDVLVTHPLRFIFGLLQHLAQAVAGEGCAAYESFGRPSNSVATSLRTAAGSTSSFLRISGTRPSD